MRNLHPFISLLPANADALSLLVVSNSSGFRLQMKLKRR